MVFLRSLNDGKSPLVSRILLSILTILNNAVVWMLSILHLILDSSNVSSKSFGTIPSAPNTIGIIVILMFQNFFFVLWPVTSGSFLWRTSDNKSPQFSSIFVHLNSVVLWTIFILPLIYGFFVLFSKFLGITTSASTIMALLSSYITTFWNSGKVQISLKFFAFLYLNTVLGGGGEIQWRTHSFLLWFLSLFYWHINFYWLSNAKVILLEEQ